MTVTTTVVKNAVTRKRGRKPFPELVKVRKDLAKLPDGRWLRVKAPVGTDLRVFANRIGKTIRPEGYRVMMAEDHSLLIRRAK